MPIVKRSESGLLKVNSDDLPELAETVAESYNTPNAGDVFGAAFRKENSLVSAFANEASVRGSNKPDAGYDVMTDIQGYEFFAEEFINSNSREQTGTIKAQIDRELKDSAIIDQAGPLGFAAQMAAGVTDPAFLIGMFTGAPFLTKSKSITGAVVKTGVASGVAEVPAEIIKQSTQKTRTVEEAMFNIGGATLLGGILGGTVKGISKGSQARLAKQADTLIDDSPPVVTVPGDEVMKASTDPTLELVNAGKIEQWGVSPLVRTQTSNSEVTKRVASEMMETPLITKGNVEGLTAVPEGGAVETRVKLWDAPLADHLTTTRQSYLGYRKRVPKKDGAISFREFREEVGVAMRRGDKSDIPEATAVAKNARSKIFNPLKDEAIAAKLLPEDVSVDTAVSYLTRVYKTPKIIAKRDEWNEIIDGWLKSEHGEIGGDELIRVRNSVTNTIMGTASGRTPYDIIPLGRGPLKERTFNIPDGLIEDFLESDIDLVSRQYLRTMAPDVELTKRFGRADLEDQIAEIVESYNQKLDEATTEKSRRALSNRRDADIRDIEAMRDRIRGTYRTPEDPNSFFIRANRALRDINFLRMLGGMTLSAIPDLARPVAVNGLRPVAKGLASLATSPKRFNMARLEAKKAAVGLDMVLNSRASSLAEITDVYARGTSAERSLRAASDVFAKVTLMSPWNAALKQFSGVVTSDNILTQALKSADGSINKKWAKRLAASGIDAPLAKRIAAEFAEHGDDGTIKLAQADKWTDEGAMESFRAAVLKEVDRTIVTPGKGEAPLWTSSETGKLIFQFKTFASSAHHKILLAELQHRDMQALNGFLMSVALGSLTYGLKEFVAGREVSTEPQKLIVESLDRSGAFGYLWDLNNIAEKATRGTVGVNPLFGASPMSRYASRNVTGALLGPSLGTAEDIIQTTGAATSGDFRRADLRRLRKLMPGQNLFYMRRILNELEEKAGRRLPR